MHILYPQEWMVEALHTLDPSLIKADENSIELQRTEPPSMPDIFAFELPQEGSAAAPTTTPAVMIDGRPQQTEAVNIERGSILAALAPEDSISQVSTPSMVYMSAMTFQTMAQRLSWAEAQLFWLMQ